MAKEKEVIPKRGDVYIVNFGSTVGSEIKKTRPALVVQNNIGNTYSPTIIIAAITAHKASDRIFPTEVIIRKKEGGLKRDSLILLNQVRTVDKKRLIKKIGRAQAHTMYAVDRALAISLGLFGV